VQFTLLSIDIHMPLSASAHTSSVHMSSQLFLKYVYGFKHQFFADDICVLLVQQSNAVYTVGDFMTRKENLHVVKPTTSVDEGTSPSQCDERACLHCNF
jgi:hypothetical protein